MTGITDPGTLAVLARDVRRERGMRVNESGASDTLRTRTGDIAPQDGPYRHRNGTEAMRPDDKAEIARRFKRLRRRSLLTQRWLAELIGICRQAVSEIEQREPSEKLGSSQIAP
jgi:DNA-binding XRE family transcriptional regulator